MAAIAAKGSGSSGGSGGNGGGTVPGGASPSSRVGAARAMAAIAARGGGGTQGDGPSRGHLCRPRKLLANRWLARERRATQRGKRKVDRGGGALTT